jgi:hypothetical protein
MYWWSGQSQICQCDFRPNQLTGPDSFTLQKTSPPCFDIERVSNTLAANLHVTRPRGQPPFDGILTGPAAGAAPSAALFYKHDITFKILLYIGAYNFYNITTQLHSNYYGITT